MKHLFSVSMLVVLLIGGCAPILPAADATNAAQPQETVLPGTTAVATCTGVLTSPNMEGPYYKAGAPERASLIEPGMLGTPIRVSGHVFDQTCTPLTGARVDFWQADASGAYDNEGYTLRGYVVTDADGAYVIDTIEPGIYPGRPPHVHVKVFAPDGRELLTTQMYFAGSEDSGDVRAAPDLLAPYLGPDAEGRQQIAFDFVVRN